MEESKNSCFALNYLFLRMASIFTEWVPGMSISKQEFERRKAAWMSNASNRAQEQLDAQRDHGYRHAKLDSTVAPFTYTENVPGWIQGIPESQLMDPEDLNIIKGKAVRGRRPNTPTVEPIPRGVRRFHVFGRDRSSESTALKFMSKEVTEADRERMKAHSSKTYTDALAALQPWSNVPFDILGLQQVIRDLTVVLGMLNSDVSDDSLAFTHPEMTNFASMSEWIEYIIHCLVKGVFAIAGQNNPSSENSSFVRGWFKKQTNPSVKPHFGHRGYFARRRKTNVAPARVKKAAVSYARSHGESVNELPQWAQPIKEAKKYLRALILFIEHAMNGEPGYEAVFTEPEFIGSSQLLDLLIDASNDLNTWCQESEHGCRQHGA